MLDYYIGVLIIILAIPTMIKPIKRKLLPNTVTYQKYLGDSGTGDTYDTIATLQFVALQTRRVKQVTTNGLIAVSNATLFVDAYNSLVDDEQVSDDLLTVKSKVSCNGIDYIVTDVEAFDYELNKGIHHWEVTLL